MKYKVNYNDRVYEVEVEVAEPMTRGEYLSYAPTPAVPVAEAVPAAPAVSPAPATPVAANGECVAAPMPGNILKVHVAPGQAVKEGDVLVILEAMKMENEIVAPRSGTVTQVLVSNGTVVDTDAPLVVLS